MQMELSSSHEYRPRTGSILECIPQRWSHWGVVRNILAASSASVVSPASGLCVLLPLENLLWVKLRDYAVSRVNPNPKKVFLVRVVKM
jgi:hypothetical protein